MDLLAGYGSSSSSADDDEKEKDENLEDKTSSSCSQWNKKDNRTNQFAVGASITLLPPPHPTDRRATTTTAAAIAPTTTATSTATASTRSLQELQTVRQKGKKLLSLASVLPAHILHRLTKNAAPSRVLRQQQQQQGEEETVDSGDSDSSSSSDDDDNNYYKDSSEKKETNHRTRAALPTLTSTSTAILAKDMGISNFLSELQQTTLTNNNNNNNNDQSSSIITADETTKLERNTQTDTTNMTNSGNSNDDNKKKEKEIMGAAFLNPVSEMIFHKQQQKQTGQDALACSTRTVRNIHETVTASSSTTTARAPDFPETLEPTAATAVATATAAGSFRRVMAAPRVKAGVTNLSIPGMQQVQVHPQQPPTYSTYTQQQQQQPFGSEDQHDDPSTTSHNNNKPKTWKRSRQEMERALRQGNMDSVANNNNHKSAFVQLEQARPDAYQPPEPEAYQLKQQQQHGVRVVPTRMYDPTTGQAVLVHPAAGSSRGGDNDNDPGNSNNNSSILKKARGKNQINQLLQSAAALEMARANAAATSTNASSQLGKLHRANAKRKYGW